MLAHIFLGILALTLGYIYYLVSIPRHLPRNLPAVPLWLQVYDAFRGASKSEVYNGRVRPLIEKHGAVLLWWEGYWTVLTNKPEHLVKIFKNSDRTVKKRGLAERIPWGSGAKLFGINLIDSEDELYAYFRKLLMPGFTIPAPMDYIKSRALWLAETIWEGQASVGAESGVRVGPPVWRWALSVWGEYYMDAQFDHMDFFTFNIQQILGVQNRKLMGRIKGVFPFLDRLPFKLPVTSHTDKLLYEVQKKLINLAETRAKLPPTPGSENKVGYLLHRARQEGSMSDFHYGCNLKQLFIAGHENVETVLNSAMEELANHPDIQDLLFEEVTKLLPENYTTNDLDQLPLLNSVIYEAMRLYPPLGHMTNRLATEPFQLDENILIPAGVMMGWHAYGVQTDPQVWGENARKFDPTRWGSDAATVRKNFRTRQSKGEYIPFGIYARKCLGSSLSLTLLQCTISELVRNLRWEHPQGYRFSYGKATLVVPDNITATFTKRENSVVTLNLDKRSKSCAEEEVSQLVTEKPQLVAAI